MPPAHARFTPHALALGLTVAALLPGTARAQVTNTLNDAPGSLRDAIDTAVDDGEIVFTLTPPVADPLISVLPPPLIVDVDGLTIDGRGAPGLMLQADDPAEVHLSLQNGSTLTIIDIHQPQGIVELDGTLIYQTDNETTLGATLQDVMGGVGTLEKTGTSTLILTGPNTYSGGTTLREGILQGDSTSLQGNIVNGATLVFDESSMDPGDGTFSGVISDLNPMTDPGAVEKIGDGAVTFDGGQQLWTGGTTVREGTLVLAPGTSLDPSGDVQIEGPGTLRIEMNALTTFNGAVSGTGTLELDGNAQMLVLNAGQLTGALSFDDQLGGANIVEDSANVVRGNVRFNDSGGTLRLKSGGLLNGAISGTDGTLEIDLTNAAEAVTLRGVNSHPTTRVMVGRLVGDTNSLVNAIQNDDRVEINQQGPGVLTATINGPGSLAKTGAGAVTVGFDQGYTGDTTISEGTLDLGADLTATTNIAVASGATLSGSGDATSAALAVSGTVAPTLIGDPLSVASATFQPGSAFRAAVRDDGIGTLLQATGDIDASGASARLDITPGDYTNPVSVTILESTAGALTGSPSLGQSAELAFLTLTPVVGPSTFQVDIQGSLTGLTNFATTQNQLAVATDLQGQFDALALAPMPGSPLDVVGQNFLVLTANEATRAYDDLSGEAISAFTTAHLASAQRFARSLHRRARGEAWGSETGLLGGARPTATPRAGATPTSHTAARVPGLLFAPAPQDTAGVGVWGELWGGLGEVDGDRSAADIEYGLAGGTLAADLRIGGGGMLGLAVGYAYADIDLPDRETSAYAHAGQAALYGGWSDARGYLSAAGRFSWARNHNERDIVFAQFAETAEADFDTLGFGAGAELGINAARLGPVVLQPVAAIDWTELEQEAFDESGAGALDLDVERETTTSLQSSVGLTLNTRFEFDERSHFIPELRGRWLHEFGDTDRVVRSRLEGALTGGLVRVAGAETPRDSILAGVGWATSIEGFWIAGNYDAVFDSDRLDHLLSITARFAF